MDVDPTYRKKGLDQAVPAPNEATDGSVEPPEPPESPELPGHDSFPLVGQVAGFRERSEGGWIVWSFRLERFDSKGNRLPPVPVAMRATSFSGFVQDGDEVEVHGTWGADDAVQCEKLRNRTMRGTWVEGKDPTALIRSVGALIGASFFFSVVIFVIIALAAVVIIGTLLVTMLS